MKWTTVAWAIAASSLAWVTGVSAQCLDGTITSEFQDSGPFAGTYKYTMEITWDTPQGLSHVTLDCGLDACADVACGADWFFDDPAGHGTGGEPDDCEFDFTGEFNCSGDPSADIDFPILKWDAIDDGDCEAGATGTATLCFYSPFPPSVPDATVVLIKNDTQLCEGTVVGECPLACSVPTLDSTWTGVKREF